MLRLLLDAQTVAFSVKLCNTIAFGVIDIIAKYRGPAVLFGIDDGLLQHPCEAAAIEDVVAENQTSTVVADEFLTDNECLGQSVGRGLFSIFKPYTQLAAVA